MLKREPKLILEEHHFLGAQPAVLEVTGSKDETLISDKLHDHSDHVLIQKKAQQLARKATVQDSVICCC